MTDYFHEVDFGELPIFFPAFNKKKKKIFLLSLILYEQWECDNQMSILGTMIIMPLFLVAGRRWLVMYYITLIAFEIASCGCLRTHEAICSQIALVSKKFGYRKCGPILTLDSFPYFSHLDCYESNEKTSGDSNHFVTS